MANVIPLPTGLARQRRLRGVDHPESNETPATNSRRWQWMRAAGHATAALGTLVARLTAHFVLTAIAGALTFVCGAIFLFAMLAFLALAVLALVECYRHWQDTGVFIPMAEATGALFGAYLGTVLLARGAHYLKYRVQPNGG